MYDYIYSAYSTKSVHCDKAPAPIGKYESMISDVFNYDLKRGFAKWK